MDFESHEICEKIINDIDGVFIKDSNLYVFNLVNGAFLIHIMGVVLMSLHSVKSH